MEGPGYTRMRYALCEAIGEESLSSGKNRFAMRLFVIHET